LRRVHIIGRKNSGKTTLIIDLVKCLTAQGHAVGTIKHTHHRHELDTPGKDSHRHREAGARVVGILSQQMTAVFRPRRDAEGAVDRYALLAPNFLDCDLVLVEGDLQAQAPKVEVWRASLGEAPLASRNETILAVITDDPLDLPVSTWSRSSIEALADQIRRLAG